ncbi:hypothetical protein EVAR_5622_1 [Eumeta japonica]|uniref:Uncharacterized protein n=1 Tax=Eumeta variegata TaxID=151549 RepID=A0A4C1T9Q8_EUMVA|nr:hypothetical protein EVAR_5622_1 [Eumeta japonica]
MQGAGEGIAVGVRAGPLRGERAGASPRAPVRHTAASHVRRCLAFTPHLRNDYAITRFTFQRTSLAIPAFWRSIFENLTPNSSTHPNAACRVSQCVSANWLFDLRRGKRKLGLYFYDSRSIYFFYRCRNAQWSLSVFVWCGRSILPAARSTPRAMWSGCTCA